jgi:hypothetical protein
MSFSTVAYAALDMSVLQQPVLPVLHLDVPLLKYGAPFSTFRFTIFFRFEARNKAKLDPFLIVFACSRKKKYFSHLFTFFSSHFSLRHF